MVQSNLNFCSTSREERLASPQKPELNLWFWRTLLCSIDIFDPQYNRKKLFKKETSILDNFV